MTMSDRKFHWERVYGERSPEEVGWYQSEPTVSLELIRASGVALDEPIIDVGGGASVLVDHLLDAGFTDLAVLDLSGNALRRSQERLGPRAPLVTWHEADITTFDPDRSYALWHDRAVFHFLTEAADTRAYVASLRRSLRVGGAVIIAAFGLDGPTKCSGLDVVRYDETSLCLELGDEFHLAECRSETHVTPGGKAQEFSYFRYVRMGPEQSQGAKEA